MKTQTQVVTEYIGQLKELNQQSELIKKEIEHHVVFEHLQNRVGSIKQQLQYIKHNVIPKTAEERAKLFKHNKLALKLMHKHIDEACGDTMLQKLKEEDEAWEVVRELRERTLKNLEHIEATIEKAETHHEQNEIEAETKDILIFEAEVIELTEKNELLLKEIESHEEAHELGGIFEQIHHLHHQLQFIKVHAYSRQHDHDTIEHATEAALGSHEFLNHHFEIMNEITAHMFHLHNHWGHYLHALKEERTKMAEAEMLHKEIQHTIHQFEAKLEEIKDEKLHHVPHPTARPTPISIKREK